MGYALKISINVQITPSVRPQNALANERFLRSLCFSLYAPENLAKYNNKIEFKEIWRIRFQISRRHLLFLSIPRLFVKRSH